MTRVLAVGCQPDFRPEHSTAKAFESLLRSFAAASTVARHMRGRERFVAAYPRPPGVVSSALERKLRSLLARRARAYPKVGPS